ncbi:MAG: TrkH family potassium uptake protein [Lachnotalea sp.]
MVMVLIFSKKFTQSQMIVLGFFIIIITGTLFLMLPIATRGHGGASFLDALFTATSATCVTGLVVRDTCQYWTIFGQIVIIVLIQIGGLGFMTIGVFFSIILRRKIGLRTRGILQESVNTLQIGGIVRLAKKIIWGTVFFESVGAILLSIRFSQKYGPLKGIYYGVFHSISAFCNAGFDLMGNKSEYISFTEYADDWIVNITIMSLVVIGGVGFLVWDDISVQKFNFKKYKLHSKIVLMTTAILISSGAILFYLFEKNYLMTDMSPSGVILSSLFSSITARTAGFNTIDTSLLQENSKMLTMVLMFIGGSPGSTAGGIKTTTVVVLIIYLRANIKKINGCNIFGRRLDDDTIKKASAVLCTNLLLAVVATMMVASSQHLALTDVLFEVISAIGTVGMSTGITRDLNTLSRIIIIFLMYCGRVGSLSFALSIGSNKKTIPVSQPVEHITIG